MARNIKPKSGFKKYAKSVSSFVIGIVLMVLVIAWLAGAFETKIAPEILVKDPPVPEGTVDSVHEVTKPNIEETIGTLKAASRTEISSKLLATIKSITVRAGDKVSKNDNLIILDSSDLKSRLQQAEQVHISAISKKKSAQKNFDRVKKLLRRKAATQSDYDRAENALNVALAEEKRSKQAIEEAKVVLGYSVIKSPSNGRIVDRLAEPGDTASPGIPLLVIYDDESLRLEAPVLEHLAIKLKVGQKVNVYVDALKKEVNGTIDEIVPQADVRSRSFLVKVILPQMEGLYEGMFGRLRILAGERKHLCLPTEAIQKVGQLEFVNVVLPDNQVEKRYIKTGQLGLPGRIEVLSGLNANDKVLIPKTNRK